MFDREKLVLETVHIRKREFIEQPKHIVYAADQTISNTSALRYFLCCKTIPVQYIFIC